LRPGEHDVEVRLLAARDEPLLAVQHPLAVLPPRGRADRGDVRACSGLRDGPGLHPLVPEDGTHPAFHLLGARQLEQLDRPPLGDAEAEPVGRLASLLLEHDLAEHRERGAALVGGDVEIREPRGTRLLLGGGDRVEIELPALRDLHLERVDLRLHEAGSALAQLDVLGGKLWNHGCDLDGFGCSRSTAARWSTRRAASVPSRIASSSPRGLRQSPACSTASPAAVSCGARSATGTRPKASTSRSASSSSVRSGAKTLANRTRPFAPPSGWRWCRISTPPR